MDRSIFVPRPSEGLNYPNVVQMFEARAAKTPSRAALRYKREGTWRAVTWEQWREAACELAAGLYELGLRRGDAVAVLSRSRLEWGLLDLAIAMAGAVSVPIYPSLTAAQTAYILVDSHARLLVAEHPDDVAALVQAPPEGLDHIVLLEAGEDPAPVSSTGSDGPAGVTVRPFGAVRELGQRAAGQHRAALAAVRDDVTLDDPMTIVYTSGTTGEQKGVVLTHRNVVFESWAIRNVIPVDETDEQLLVLPLAHIFSRHMLWGAVEQGAVTAFTRDVDDLSTALLEIAPTFMAGVPRLYEKIHARVLGEIRDGGNLKQGLFTWCLDVGRKVSVCKQRGQAVPTTLALKWAVADRSMFARIRAMFGGRLRFFVSGGAPLSREIAEFFHAAGILILEGYGLTETTGATNVNRPDRFRFGTVGPAMPGCELRIAADGEVLIRGHNIMHGYHNLPEETAEALDADGWLRTGDIGELTDGFLRITDRKKDLLKTAGGKYIAPAPIEKSLALKEGIAYVMIHGDRKPFAVALVSLDEDEMMALSKREGLGVRSYGDLVRHPRVRQLVQGHVDAVNASLASYERIKRFALVPRPFSQEAGELTPTLKVRRKEVAAHHADLLEGLYEGAHSPLDSAPERSS